MELEGTRWILTGLVDEAGQMIDALPDVEATATFEDGRVSGNSSCNRYGAGYTLVGNRLSISPGMMSTMMACPEPLMRQEAQFQAALAAAASYSIEGTALTIWGAGRQALLTLAADEPAPLTGTTWVARNYNNGRQAVVSILGGTRLTALFGEDGRLGGSAGCNNYFAGYTLDGNGITISPPAATRKLCAEPEGIMEQESRYLMALPTAATYRIEGKALELRTAEGALVASFSAA